MAFAKRPSQPPDFDGVAFAKRLREIAEKVGLGPFDTLADNRLPRYLRWINSTVEFDGADKGGIRDVVAANADALDDLKEDFDNHRAIDNARHTALAQRVTALEGQQTSTPFPGSG